MLAIKKKAMSYIISKHLHRHLLNGKILNDRRHEKMALRALHTGVSPDQSLQLQNAAI